MRGIEPRAFHMQSERSTTELHPRRSKFIIAIPNSLTLKQFTYNAFSLDMCLSYNNEIELLLF